jgi:phosphoribosylformimino-5-aminoimidazole carboxamide ribonucleotide (ProFAR) isomerase
LEDVRRLQAVSAERPNLVGVIVGKALYDGRVTLRGLQG